MKKIKYLLIMVVAVMVSVSCNNDDDDDEETCEEYNARWAIKFEAVDAPEEVFELLFEYAANLPEGCEAIEE